MTLPSWQNEGFGGKIRAALWLETEVGLGNTFTKTQLRAAFPNVAQIDRRLRDLRDYGWQIHTSRDDASLNQDEQRYAHRGAEVWIPGQVKTPQHKNSLTAQQRTKVMQADDFLCRTCGIGAGESYDDSIDQAQLNVTRRPVRLTDGTIGHQLVTECKRCRSGGSGTDVDLGELLAMVEALGPLECKVLAGWIKADRRSRSALEKLWGNYRGLPEESRRAVEQALTSGQQ
ncbi:hypothetical protein [Streptomyces johnsoniae]|uniref:HNH endonuclease n=1 Tax=Streptomyces johnsoniae TaxID=3075532 RepID=A0ABU2SHF3_9ACTN|nr:hypothetical protein [Streptomyces sp. DSM 41886]MDT0447299.1 hypothetical protein [Streptomyces sp. DSM 41886]